MIQGKYGIKHLKLNVTCDSLGTQDSKNPVFTAPPLHKARFKPIMSFLLLPIKFKNHQK